MSKHYRGLGLCSRCQAAVGDKEKVALLEHYAEREPHYFVQFDGWLAVEPGDELVVPDKQRDALTGAPNTCELRNDNIAIRIQILEGTSRKDVKRLLPKLVAWIKRSYSETRGIR